MFLSVINSVNYILNLSIDFIGLVMYLEFHPRPDSAAEPGLRKNAFKALQYNNDYRSNLLIIFGVVFNDDLIV